MTEIMEALAVIADGLLVLTGRVMEGYTYCVQMVYEIITGTGMIQGELLYWILYLGGLYVILRKVYKKFIKDKLKTTIKSNPEWDKLKTEKSETKKNWNWYTLWWGILLLIAIGIFQNTGYMY